MCCIHVHDHTCGRFVIDEVGWTPLHYAVTHTALGSEHQDTHNQNQYDHQALAGVCVCVCVCVCVHACAYVCLCTTA